MSLAATVLVPTHDHGPTLLRSIPSALAQTVEDLEVLVVGDGVPDVTREVMAELTASDERVRFIDNPKGPRHGEVHRHKALEEARGEIVCYLSDDDLWLPSHVEELRALLAEADFAHTRPFWFDEEGGVQPLLIDLREDAYRRLLLGGENRIPLSCAGHTLALYRRLPEGWRTTPAGTFTDLYMWQQILSDPGCRAVSGARPSVLNFPTPARLGWSVYERLAELDRWTEQLGSPTLESELAVQLLDKVASGAETLEASLLSLRAAYEELSDAGDRQRIVLSSTLEEVERDRAELSRRLDGLAAQLYEVDMERASLSNRLDELGSSATWRLRARLIGLPGVGSSFRWAARALARPPAPGATGSPHPGQTPEPLAQPTESAARDRPTDTTARR